jgi:hypothetical protein
MIEVHGLALSFGAVRIDEDNFSRQPAQQQSISKGCANTANPDHGNSRGPRVYPRFSRHSIVLTTWLSF